MRSLADNRDIVIKKADNGFRSVLWDRYDYIAEVEKHLKDENVFKDVEFTEKVLQDFVETSNKMFGRLKPKGKIDEKQLTILHMNTKRPLI